MAAGGGGIYAVSGSPVTLELTLIARNTPSNCSPPGGIAGCSRARALSLGISLWPGADPGNGGYGDAPVPGGTGASWVWDQFDPGSR